MLRIKSASLKTTPGLSYFHNYAIFEIEHDIYYKKQLSSYAILTYARFFEDTMIA